MGRKAITRYSIRVTPEIARQAKFACTEGGCSVMYNCAVSLGVASSIPDATRVRTTDSEVSFTIQGRQLRFKHHLNPTVFKLTEQFDAWIEDRTGLVSEPEPVEFVLAEGGKDNTLIQSWVVKFKGSTVATRKIKAHTPRPDVSERMKGKKYNSGVRHYGMREIIDATSASLN